ncbi:methyl-accepting chemotaxis protein [Salirhabdus sp. Marseille-P4669]|uniref:methyl-accepting chemotaxis protein n=1 Tax=Salirhabdus sp. Marseille-P4669 TaxID=2042310 RepID=UPI000C7CF767|nr:methyl-accepting chemotaxis protein [Salirhabdus sp. Marseille-P4669]
MKTIKGKIGFILSLSIISLIVVILFSIYFFHQQVKMTSEMQEIDVIITDSETINEQMLTTRYEEEKFLHNPSPEQADVLMNSIQSVQTNAKTYAAEHDEYSDIAETFQSIANNALTYKGEVEIVTNMHNKVGYNANEGKRKELNDIYSETYTLVQATNHAQLMTMLLEMRVNESQYVENGVPSYFESFDETFWSFKEVLEDPSIDPEQANTINENLLNYKMTLLDIRSNLDQTTKNINQFSTISQNVQTQIKDVNATVQSLKQELLNEQEETQGMISSLLIVIGVLALIVLVVTGLLLNRSILKSIQTLKNGAEIMGNGDLAYRVEIKGKDEMAELASSFNRMAEKMHNSLVKVLNASKVLGESSGNLTEISQNTSLQTNEISIAINQVAVGAQEQASQIEESTNLISQVDAAIEKTKSAGLEILTALKKAETDSQQGIEKIKVLENTSESFIKLANHLSSEVKEASQQSKKINKIVSTIQEIADNTNLLALNAAIESARAGENGRGFAVVADEVRKLAERSKQEAEEIYKLISSMTKQMNSLSIEAEKFDVYEKEQANSVEETKHTFSSISKQVYDMNDMMEGVNASVVNITSANETLKQKIHEISVISEESVATAEEVAASSEHQTESIVQLNSAAQSLHAISQELETEVSEFKIDENIVFAEEESEEAVANEPESIEHDMEINNQSESDVDVSDKEWNEENDEEEEEMNEIKEKE